MNGKEKYLNSKVLISECPCVTLGKKVKRNIVRKSKYKLKDMK